MAPPQTLNETGIVCLPTKSGFRLSPFVPHVRLGVVKNFACICFTPESGGLSKRDPPEVPAVGARTYRLADFAPFRCLANDTEVFGFAAEGRSLKTLRSKATF